MFKNMNKCISAGFNYPMIDVFRLLLELPVFNTTAMELGVLCMLKNHE